MPQLNEEQTITEARNEFTNNLETAGVTPITRNGKFSAVLISVGELDEDTAQRLSDLLQRNHEAGIAQLLSRAFSESD